MITIGAKEDAIGLVKLLDHNTVGAFISHVALTNDKLTKEEYDKRLAQLLENFLNYFIKEEN